MIRKTTTLLLCLMATLSASAQYKSQVWSPDNGDGTYTNPVINADYSDPDVCVGPSGEDYYMTASSFHCTPGLPILHSKDLVNWQIVGYALKNLYEGNSELLAHFSSKPQHGNGVWAPSIRYHAGQYYIYWGDPDFGVMMVKTKNGDPAGEWEQPVCVIRGKGYIDTCPLWDEDGRCYLVNGWANSRSKFASVLTVREMTADGTKAIGQPVIVFDGNGNENRTCEGPKFYKRDGWYWIMCPAGGVPTGFQLAMRSKSPYGPYEHKIVLAQGKTNINGPHQGGWVHTKYGEDWFLHFQDKEAYGRVVHLNPVDWSSGWPIMGNKGEPVTTYRKPSSNTQHPSPTTQHPSPITNPVESDEFNTPSLGLQWQWHGNYDEKFGVPTAFGTFRIYTHKLSKDWKNLWEVPNMLLQKTPADAFTVTTKLRFTSKAEGQMGGLIMMGLDYSALVVRRSGDAFELVQLTCKAADKGTPQTETVIATLKPTAVDKTDYKPGIHEDIYLRLKVCDSKLRFSWSQDGKEFKNCGEEFQMKEGKWIGAKFGFVSVETNPDSDRGWIDADWIRITKTTTIFVIGDSTAANKDTTGGKQERGWAMMLQQCFDASHIVVDNHAVNGRSSKSFIDEGRWEKVLERINPGDYVIIQFGHNDEKAQPERHTDPGSTFDDNLAKFVRETRDHGGIPVLMNSVVRRNFLVKAPEIADDELLRNSTFKDGAKMIEGDSLIDTHGLYKEAPKDVARRMNCHFVDANKITHDLEQGLGREKSKKLHMWFLPGEEPSEPNGKQDNTHYNIYGATTVAKLLADALCNEIPLLKKYKYD